MASAQHASQRADYTLRNGVREASMDLELAGKRAIVTGGSRGIGKAIAFQLAREGCDVAITARGQEALEVTAAEIREATGRRIVAIPCDTGSDESVHLMVETAVAGLGGVEILVNAAAKPGGQAPAPRLGEITGDAFWDEMNIKVLGYLRCAREVAPYLQAAGWGRIINISGLAARQAGSALGSMRNVAVAALTKNLADELGPSGVNVTVVHPGLTFTERTPEIIAARAEATGTTLEAVESTFGRGNLIRRLVTKEEIADVVAFLASPRSVAINGDAIAAGGGAPGAIHY